MKKKTKKPDLKSYFEERLKCTRCGEGFKRMDADFRDVPAAPIDGISTYTFVPSCPACKKPLLFNIAP